MTRVTRSRSEVQDIIDRNVKLATTYVRKAEHFLYDLGPDHPKHPPTPGYWDLLDVMLDTAEAIVNELPESFFETTELVDWFGLREALGVDLTSSSMKHNMSDDALERAEKVVAALRRRREAWQRRRLIERLENTEGREPEEARAYLAKAAELRERHGIPKVTR